MHTWDYVRGQDGVASAASGGRAASSSVRASVAEVSGTPALHGVAGWQMNAYVPQLQQELGFRFAFDTRGSAPFLPQLAPGSGVCRSCPRPCRALDELIGRPDLHGADPVEHLLALTAAAAGRDKVFDAARRS